MLTPQSSTDLDFAIWRFYDGSAMIDRIVPGGIEAFRNASHEKQQIWRGEAIDLIHKECQDSMQPAVVAGHLMFWEEGKKPEFVYTKNDLSVYTHMLYLWNRPLEIIKRCRGDPRKARAPSSPMHLFEWQEKEMEELRRLCLKHGILFSALSPGSELSSSRIQKVPIPQLPKASKLLADFKYHTEQRNVEKAKECLSSTLAESPCDPKKTMLVFDADKTMSAADGGKIFWQHLTDDRQRTCAGEPWLAPGTPFAELFDSPLGHTYTAFRQHTLFFEDLGDDQLYETLCQKTSHDINLHPEILALLRAAAKSRDIGAVVITSGLRRVWEMVLAKEGLSQTVRVIGGGRIADGFIVDATVKGALVDMLREYHNKKVIAFGDSPLDLKMLEKADQAIVVVGEQSSRSESMEAQLDQALKGRLQASQVLLPPIGSPRLNAQVLPVLRLDPSFHHSIFASHDQENILKTYIAAAANQSSTKLLMTPTRDNTIDGPRLREAHRLIGWYLATEFLTQSNIIGLEEYDIRHVQLDRIKGYRLRGEERTIIVALMRAGEPMALGVNDAFPLANFRHAHEPTDLQPIHFEGKGTVILVDSVINSGKTIKVFVERIRQLNGHIPIIIVANVIQNEFIDTEYLQNNVKDLGQTTLVALRISSTSFPLNLSLMYAVLGGVFYSRVTSHSSTLTRDWKC